LPRTSGATRVFLASSRGRLSNRVLARIVAAVAGSLALPLAISTPALASVSSTAVTASTARSYELFDQTSSGAVSERRISGTSDGTAGDSIDLVAAEADGTRRILARDIAVGSNGSWKWTGSFAPLADNRSDRDRPFISRSFTAVAAVPAGDELALPGDSHWRGFALTVAAWNEYREAGANWSTDYLFSQVGRSAWNDYNSFDSCGLCDGGLKLPDGATGPPLWFWNASVDGPFQMRTVSGVQQKVPSITVDGKAAYAGFFASRINPSSGSLPHPMFTRSVNPATGEATITETQPLVSCQSFPAETAGDCPDFSSTGVTLFRTIKQSADGTNVGIADFLSSTDSRSHSWEIHYINAVHAGPGSAGWQLPGAVKWSTATPSGPQSGGSTDWSMRLQGTGPTSVIRARNSLRSAASEQNPAGSISVNPRPLRVWFPNPGADRISIDMGGTTTAAAPSRVAFAYGLFTTPRLKMIGSSLSGTNVIINMKASGAGVGSLRASMTSGTGGSVCGMKSVRFNAGANRIVCPLTFTGRRILRARAPLAVAGTFTADPWSPVSYSLATTLR